MILHLVTDEKFTDYAINQFSQLSIPSEFVLIPSNHETWIMKQTDRCTIIEQHSPKFDDLLKRLGEYTGVVFHGMFWSDWQVPILKHIPSHVKVAWVFWGGEVYFRSDIKDTRYAPITKFVLRTRSLARPEKKVGFSYDLPYEVYQRIDYCLTDEYEEYEYAKNVLKSPQMKHLWYSYYDINETLGSLKGERCNGNNVIVGNSATIECNYFDVIPQLRRYLKKDQKVVLPLSYGSPWVKNAVTRYSKFWLGNDAMCLLEFMEREDYNRILQSCSTMIMAHYNPQAQGNILTGLWLGMRVYLSERSIAYKFFKRLGFVVFSFESEFKRYKYMPLSESEREMNRQVLIEWYSAEHVQEAASLVAKELG